MPATQLRSKVCQSVIKVARAASPRLGATYPYACTGLRRPGRVNRALRTFCPDWAVVMRQLEFVRVEPTSAGAERQDLAVVRRVNSPGAVRVQHDPDSVSPTPP